MQIALAVFPGFTALDAIGPYQVLTHLPGAETLFVADQAGPVQDNGRLTVNAHAAFEDVPEPDVVVVAGGLAAIQLATSDSSIVQWLQAVHPGATWTTSVCTGALILGAAGLLSGRRATTHWHFTERLREHAAIPTSERVVVDGNIITAAGVSAGIDMALTLAAHLVDEQTAMTIQLDLEYAPQPPFDAGTPKTAPVSVVSHLRQMYDLAPRMSAECCCARHSGTGPGW